MNQTLFMLNVFTCLDCNTIAKYIQDIVSGFLLELVALHSYYLDFRIQYVSIVMLCSVITLVFMIFSNKK